MTSVTPALLRAPTRRVLSQVFDSARWDVWRPRPDDIIVSTFPKCGTTWTQRIISLLLSQDPSPREIDAPWFDMRLFPMTKEDVARQAEAISSRRQLKAHLPYDALPIFAGVKIVHVARDGRDAAMSMHNHMLGFKPAMRQRIVEINKGDPRLGDVSADVPEEPRVFFRQWLNEDCGARGDPGGGFFHHENSFWGARRESNVLLVHYNDLKKDRDGEMRRISAFLDIPIDEERWPSLVDAASFEAMQRDGARIMPRAEASWEGGARRFFYKGTNGRWQDAVAPEDLALFDAMMRERCSPALARWLEHGRLVAGDPDASAD